MAEHTDNQQGRMLFTDFDVSDKGRPVSVLPAEQASDYFAAPLPSITELAATLEFGFEDDDGEDAPAPRAPEAEPDETEQEDATDKSAANYSIVDDDQELLLEQADALPAVAARPDISPEAPTWEEFANAFRAAPPQDDDPGKTTAFIDGETLQARLGIEPGDDPFDPVIELDGDVDILSFLSNTGLGDTRIFTPAPRERRDASQPPAEPYGGIQRVDDWFDPPEGQVEPPPATRDWFEPPEHDDSRDVGDLFGDLFDPASAGEEQFNKPTRRLDRPPAERAQVTDTNFDIFADLDIDAAWTDKVRRARPRSDATDVTDTRSLDMFSDVDLEAAWRERKGKRVASESDRLYAREARKRERKEAEDTAILDSADTLMLSEKDLFSSKTRHMPRDGGDANARKTAPDDDVDLLMELDELADAGESPDDSIEDEEYDPDLADAMPPGAALPDYLDVMDEIDDGTPGNVQAPTVDSSDIQSAAARRKTPRPELPDDADDFDPLGEEAASARRVSDVDSLVGEDFDDDSMADADAADAEPKGDDDDALSPAARRSVTTDDLLGDVDFGDESVNADVSAPVIGDGDIDDARPGPRPGTEEMQAIMGEGEFGDGAAAASEEDAAPADDVPVNPMDVFANMDDMDFSDDVDDDMRAMLDDDEAAVADIDGETLLDSPLPEEEVVEVPKSLLGKARFYAVRAARRVLPMSLLHRVDKMVAWSENWWFYCDLLAAIIASASLAVIISYYVWYRN